VSGAGGAARRAENTFPLTDWGNGERYALERQGSIIYVPQFKQWRELEQGVYVPDDAGRRYRLAAETARAIAHSGPDAPTETERRAIYAHALRSESADALERMLRCASHDARIVMRAEALDRDPMLLAIAKGKAVDLRTGEPRRLLPEDLVTKRSPICFEGIEAPAPTWERFLAEVLPSERLRAFVRRFAGYSLTGDVSEHVVAFLYGLGANGKSTFLEVLLAILGDYGKTAAPDLLLAKRSERHLAEIADLKGARLVTCSESGVDRSFDEPRLKYLTGGDRIKARFMFGDLFEFTPTHKFWIAANHKPRVRGGDDGIWRRIKLIPFTQTIPEDRRDPHIRQKLLAEAPGILAWAVRGCLEWQREGLGEPEEVRDATAEYRASEDRIALFLDERCIAGPDRRASVAAMYDTYRAWAISSGEHPMSKPALGEALEARGFERGRGTAGTRMWRGIGVRPLPVSGGGDGVTSPASLSTTSHGFSLVGEG
jgi:putative DNA primase/helicase